MSAQPLQPGGGSMWTPDAMRQRLANYTIEDVLDLPADAPRVELRDGAMIVVPSPTFDHQDVAMQLWSWLRRHTPRGYRASAAVGVAVGPTQTLEPDVVLVSRDVSGDAHYATAEQTLLVVEVVSPGTKRRDRLEKPADYAAACVPYFWRVEQPPVHVYAYELAGAEYRLVADSAEELVLSRPFEIKLPIAEITP
jgi:Uma2 family endonuclease